MRFTTRGRYALRATLALAALGKDGFPVPIHTLSEHERISSVFLEQIFCKLRKAGIVSSVRGPGGGFFFTRPLDTLTVKAILDAAGEDTEKVCCDKNLTTCDRIGACLSHRVWEEVIALVNTFFTNVTVASLLSMEDAPKEQEKREKKRGKREKREKVEKKMGKTGKNGTS
ncbi:MAG: Rrf2 family transcriptional regulator [Spirochaetaceae bacterium]|jgi:Rrf2 family iron-sulfur cluster assembly transcriptional regulator|nr:Rrf2 family transcriptional regulator [Spirochaetaceae bacterium]